MKWVKTLIWMVLFVLVILFSIHNRDEVTLRFAFSPLLNDQWEVGNVPLFLVILCSVFLGVLIGGIGDLYKRLKLKKAFRQQQKTIERLEKEIQFLGKPDTEQPSFLKKEG